MSQAEKDALKALKQFRAEILRMHPENITPQNWLAIRAELLTILQSHRDTLKANAKFGREFRRITRAMRDVRRDPKRHGQDQL